jgi:isopropylmalate/homocitrate/citramalate synthase
VRQIQGTLNGIGERCGNANLVTLIPTLVLKPNPMQTGSRSRSAGQARGS